MIRKELKKLIEENESIELKSSLSLINEIIEAMLKERKSQACLRNRFYSNKGNIQITG